MLPMAISKPTIVFIPGAWHRTDGYGEVASSLAEKGYPTVLVSLASVGADPPLTGFEEDVKVIGKAVEKLIHSGKDIILVMHSYGGIPGCQAMGPIMDNNEGENGKGRVLRLVWICGFVISEGESLHSLLGHDAPWWKVEDPIVYPMNPEHVFYADLPLQRAAHFASILRPQSYKCFHSIVTVEPWLKIPSSYLVCENDNALPVQAQECMMAYAKEKSGGKAFDHVERCMSGHSPFLSMPGTVVEYLERVARMVSRGW